MSNENRIKSKSTAIKVIVPLLLICTVIGIWAVKNANKDSKDHKIITNEHPDFALHVTEELDLEKLKSYGLPIIIDFGADACMPCKEMAPVLEELNEELQGKAIIKFIDVWKYQELAKGYPISLIPTQVFIDAEGKPYVPADPQASRMKLYSSKDIGEHVLTVHEGGMTKGQLMGILKEMGLK